MEVKFTKDQEELFLNNYAKACIRAGKLRHTDKALVKVFLLECISDMLSDEVSNRLHEEMMSDTIRASVEFLTK